MQEKPKRKFKFDFVFILIVILAAVGIYFLIRNLTKTQVETLRWDAFIQHVNKSEVNGVLTATPIEDNYGLYSITGVIKSSKTINFQVVITEDQLNELFKSYTSLSISIKPISVNYWASIIISLLPTVIYIIILFVIFRSLMKAQGGGAGGAFDFAFDKKKLREEDCFVSDSFGFKLS